VREGMKNLNKFSWEKAKEELKKKYYAATHEEKSLTELMAEIYADTCPHCGAKKE